MDGRLLPGGRRRRFQGCGRFRRAAGRALAAAAALLLLAGCSSYVPPGQPADLGGLGHGAALGGFAARPAANFPAAIAVVRLQAPGYGYRSTRGTGGVYGHGRYAIVTTREPAEEAAVQAIAALPDVHGVTGLNRLLLPAELDSEQSLRDAAARLQADLLLLYTVDTSFTDDDRSQVLSTVTLGLSPTKRVNLHVTASAVVLDTRSGYVHGTMEASEQRTFHTSAWEKVDAVERARLEAESAAVTRLAAEFVRTWPALVAAARAAAPAP